MTFYCGLGIGLFAGCAIGFFIGKIYWYYLGWDEHGIYEDEQNFEGAFGEEDIE